MNLNQITLPALDIPAGVTFYREMGFIQIVSSSHYARFECPVGDATFSLHRVEAVAPDTGVVVYFECDDLDARVATLEARGFSFDLLPTDQAWLWREAKLKDPSGNVLCLFRPGANRRNPPWRIAAGAPS